MRTRIAALCRTLGIALFFLGSTVCAQAAALPRWTALGDTSFTHVALSTDLPGGATPTSLAQDSDGFLWMGSPNGLSRWDGYHFRMYNADPTRPGALPDGEIVTLFSDARGRLWIGTNSSGLMRYDRDRDAFESYPFPVPAGASAAVRGIADDGNGGIWFGTAHGLGRIDGTTGALGSLGAGVHSAAGLPDDRISALLRARDGALWVGTKGHGVFRRDSRSSRFVPIGLPSASGAPVWAWCFAQDGGGRVWVGSVRDGAFLIAPGASRGRPVIESGSPAGPLRAQWVFTLAEARSGEMWLGTYGQGIVAVDTATMRTRRIEHDPALAASLPHNRVWALRRDRAGLIWVATSRSLSHYDARQDGIVNLFGGSSRRDRITGSAVTAILPAANDRVWLGLSENGMDLIDAFRGRVGAVRPIGDGSATALPNDAVNAAVDGAAGEVYIATVRGVYRAGRDVKTVARIAIPGRDRQAWTTTLFVDRGILWVGGTDGVHGLAIPPRRAEPIRIHDDPANEQRVTAFARGSAQTLWVGTQNGVQRLDLATARIVRVFGDSGIAALGARFVTSLLVDGAGRLWVGTDGGGIAVLDVDRNGNLRLRRHLGLTDGLPNCNIGTLVSDTRGNVWASTDDGLAVVNPRTFAVRKLQAADGAPFKAYWMGSGVRTRDGDLLFGGLDGLTVVRPDRIAQWSYRAPLAITELRAGGMTVAGAGRFNGSASAPRLTIEASANSLAVEFAALDLSAPQYNRYAYRLEGYDTHWIETDATHRLAAYTNLPAADYRLLLRGSNRGGVWTAGEFALSIRVLPAWYQMVWFRFAEAMAALLAVAALIQARTAHLRRRGHELEQLVADRTAQLRNSQQRLKALAYIDGLTTLPNRRMFDEEFNKLITRARRQGDSCALLLVDLDHFKAINDTFGHDAGDAMLVEVAQRLRSVVRASDCVARLGGDEFAILLGADEDRDSVDLVCRRLVECIATDVTIAQLALHSTPSIGIARYPQDGETPDVVYKSADLALYDAKRTRNTWCWYREELRSGQKLSAAPRERAGVARD